MPPKLLFNLFYNNINFKKNIKVPQKLLFNSFYNKKNIKVPQKLLFNSPYINEKKEIIKKFTNIKINIYRYIFSLFTLGIVTLYYIKL